MNSNDLIEDMIFNNIFSINKAEKDKILMDIFKEQLQNNKNNNNNIKTMYEKLNFNVEKFSSLTDIPYIPVNMFKKFDLYSCGDKEIVRVLNSSGTTGNPSKIYIDKKTALRQSQGLIATLKDFLGENRRPLLIADCKEENNKSSNLSARGAAIRGISSFSNNIVYAFDKVENELKLNLERVEKFKENHGNEEVLIYGFTYIIWSKLIKELQAMGRIVSLPNSKILHSGGWKKLTSQSVTKEEFSKEVSKVFTTKINNVIDFYGMVEQLGVVFIDCEYGYKHVPSFAEVIIRNTNTLEEVAFGEVGLIEVMSSLSTSYPAQAILTEDMGELIGIDSCKCGRRGKYFRFKFRVEKAEIRGCGDTFAEKEIAYV